MANDLPMRLQSGLANASRIAVLGVGSELHGDDRAGLLVTQRLLDGCTMNLISRRIKVFQGAAAPENLTGEIKHYCPSHLILIDAIDFESTPGTIKLIEPDAIFGHSSSTHTLPLKILADYLCEATNCKILIIGIQPKTLDFGSTPSPEVETSAKELGELIESIARKTLAD